MKNHEIKFRNSNAAILISILNKYGIAYALKEQNDKESVISILDEDINKIFNLLSDKMIEDGFDDTTNSLSDYGNKIDGILSSFITIKYGTRNVPGTGIR